MIYKASFDNINNIGLIFIIIFDHKNIAKERGDNEFLQYNRK